MCAEIEAFRADRSNRDDVTLVIVRRRAGDVETDEARSQVDVPGSRSLRLY